MGRETDKQRETDRKGERDRDREREADRKGEREKDKQRDRETDGQRETEREGERGVFMSYFINRGKQHDLFYINQYLSAYLIP